MSGERKGKLSQLRDIILVQLGTRALTFAINILIARLAPQNEYGVTFVSFQFYLNLTLFLAAECFRKVAQRRSQVCNVETGFHFRSALNVSWLGAWITAFVVIFSTAYWLMDTPESKKTSYMISMSLLSVAVMLEAAAEPFLIMAMGKGDFVNKAIGESAALFTRTIFMGMMTIATGDVMLAFASAQLVYGTIWLLFLGRAHPPWVADGADDPLPAALDDDGTFFLAEHKSAMKQFLLSSLLKLVLQESEKPIVLGLFSESEWGEFALVQNLGSLVLRLLFKPIEEVAYASFGQAKKKSESLPLLQALLFLQGGVGWLAVCYGPAFSSGAIRILYGSTWAASNAPLLLGAYCLQLFAMSSNGILEGYLMARANDKWLRIQQIAHVAFFGVFCGMVYWLKGFGLVSVVYATTTSMCLRCVLALVFVKFETDEPTASEAKSEETKEAFSLQWPRICVAAGSSLMAGKVCDYILVGWNPATEPLPLKLIGSAATVAAGSVVAVGGAAWKFCGLREAVKMLQAQKNKKD